MPFATLPAIGSLYYPNFNHIAWSQPGGYGTTVFPQQLIGIPFEAYPVPGQIWAENSGLWVLGCGHWQNQMRVFRDYDAETGMSAAILCCSLCTYVQRIQEPYESITNEFNFPILIP
jgi:hypothetical protein